VCVGLPLSYDTTQQLFSYHAPSVRVQVDWQLDIDPEGLVNARLREEINAPAEARIRERFESPKLKRGG